MQKTILIVDDEAPIRRLSKRLLERKEYHTLEAGTGAEGLQQLESHQDSVDAVLLDVHLPDGSGAEWALKLRELRPEIPIIYFTGSNTASLGNHGNLKDFFLKKPFTPDSITGVVGQALEA